MPIQAQSADGNLHEFPDGTAPAVVDKVMREYALANAPKEPPNSFVDALRSIPGGIAKGVAGIVGLPGDVSNLLDQGADYITGGSVSSHRVPGRIDSQQVNDLISAPTGGYYKPQTKAGKYAETIASFAPGALAPGGTVARVARVVVPGAASEAAGQFTEGTAAEPYARIIGALAGGAVTGIGEVSANAARPTPGVPTVAELKTAAHGQYSAADKAGLIVKGDSMKAMAGDLKETLGNEGMDATLHPKATAVYKNIANATDNTTLKGIDILRQQAGDAAASADPAERRLARIIKDHLDDYVGSLKPSDVVQGDAQGASEAITSARDLWSRASKGEIIDSAIQKAKTRSSQFSGSGYENALRTQFRQLSMNDRAMRRFSSDEQDAIRKVAMGGPVENALRYLGKFSPHGLVGTLMTGGAGFAAGGPVGAAAALATGEAGRIGATAMTVKNARLASELVRKGNPRSISQAAVGAGAAAPTEGVSMADKIRQFATPPTK
jgi:hypothetical protein